MNLLIAGSLSLLAAIGSAVATATLHDQDSHRRSGDPPQVELRVVDLTPRFLHFYEAALAEGADAARRWELWKEHYDFAALARVPEDEMPVLVEEAIAEITRRSRS